MHTKGSTNLNRILRVTAHLLFEKGQDVGEVYGLMQGFVDRHMLQKWYEAYCSHNGLPNDVNRKKNKFRLPMPPISWEEVTLEALEEKTQSHLDWL
jgi:hypothetical protein